MGMLQLYSADARGVVQGRKCPLPECSAASVRRVINGEYSLTAKMPAGAAFINNVSTGDAIKAKVNEEGKEQYFIVKKRTRSLSGGINVYAEHQSYYFSGVILRGGGASESGTPSLAFRQLWQGAHPSITDLSTFTFSRSSNTPAVLPAVTKPTPLRDLLFRRLVEVFGGEFDFDGFNVEWVDQLGADRGASYRYGINLTEMESNDVLDDYASGIFPYWGSLDPKTNVGIVTIPNFVLGFPGTYPIEVIKPVDLTDRFDTEPTPAQLLTAAQEYAAQNAPTGIPQSIRAERARIQGNVPIDLGDTVTAVNSAWGINKKTRVTALTFDPIAEQVTSAELGNVNPGFPGAVKNMR